MSSSYLTMQYFAVDELDEEQREAWFLEHTQKAAFKRRQDLLDKAVAKIPIEDKKNWVTIVCVGLRNNKWARIYISVKESSYWEHTNFGTLLDEYNYPHDEHNYILIENLEV